MDRTGEGLYGQSSASHRKEHVLRTGGVGGQWAQGAPEAALFCLGGRERKGTPYSQLACPVAACIGAEQQKETRLIGLLSSLIVLHNRSSPRFFV